MSQVQIDHANILKLIKDNKIHNCSTSGLYIHIPFCQHRCHYCDFMSLVKNEDWHRRFTHRLINELIAAAPQLQVPVETMFIGGGTPTLLPHDCWSDLLQAIRRYVNPAQDLEFSVEANPETVTHDLAAILTSGGINRISLGAQTFSARFLKILQRIHHPDNVERSMALFREAGTDNINLDLIFAIPGQSESDWLHDLEIAVSLQPDHLSCYALSYEPGTPLTTQLQAGQIARVDEDLEASMYEIALDFLTDAGYEHYEISNWARPGKQCRHNLGYWHNHDFWPLGPSASGHLSGLRWKNTTDFDNYMNSDALPPVTDVERLEEDGQIGEELMLGLRMTQGIERDRLDSLLARGQKVESRRNVIAQYTDDGLLTWSNDHLQLTRRGLMLADTVLSELL